MLEQELIFMQESAALAFHAFLHSGNQRVLDQFELQTMEFYQKREERQAAEQGSPTPNHTVRHNEKNLQLRKTITRVINQEENDENEEMPDGELEQAVEQDDSLFSESSLGDLEETKSPHGSRGSNPRKSGNNLQVPNEKKSTFHKRHQKERKQDEDQFLGIKNDSQRRGSLLSRQPAKVLGARNSFNITTDKKHSSVRPDHNIGIGVFELDNDRQVVKKKGFKQSPAQAIRRSVEAATLGIPFAFNTKKTQTLDPKDAKKEKKEKEFIKPQKTVFGAKNFRCSMDDEGPGPGFEMIKTFTQSLDERTAEIAAAQEPPPPKNYEEFQLELKDQSKLREITILLDRRLKMITWRLVPLAVGLSLFFIMYFVIQYLLFQKQIVQILDNSTRLSDLIQSLECQERLIGDIGQLFTSNSTQYDVLKDIKVSLDKRTVDISREFTMNKLNDTFTNCLRLNQKVSNWLQTAENEDFFLQAETTTTSANNNQTSNSQTLCSLFDENDKNIEMVSLKLNFTRAQCEEIYSGVLKRATLQSISLFLQDSMYSAIRFLSTTKSRDSDFIQETLQQHSQLLDAHTFYQQNALRGFYGHAIAEVLSSQETSTASVALYAVYICILILAALSVQFLILEKVKRWFWNSFILLQLLPRDDIDKEFIKTINEFLKRS